MPLKIEDYALIGDCETAALVGRDGSIDWLCLPRFDSDACFSALLGTLDNGRWLLSPASQSSSSRRRYRGDTLVLETRHETAQGSVNVIDFMPQRTGRPVVIRIVEGQSGTVPMRMELVLRFGYGKVVPWVRKREQGIVAIGGPDAVVLQSDVDTRGEDLTTVADFSVSQGQRIAFSLTWFESHREPPSLTDPTALLEDTTQWWREWASRCNYRGPWRDAVVRSLITLKALTFTPTGGIVAAPTTSLPEQLGGSRNWDYRYCWLRDATMTLFAFMSAGYVEEAAAWREWLLRAAAGDPSDLQIAYGVCGERRLTEITLDWLGGYEKSLPVRIGNAAYRQFQLDVYGELIDAMFQCRSHGLDPHQTAWQLELALLKFLERSWQEPDEGIWEMRGPRQHFTHSKVMAWVALDRAIKSVERIGLDGPVERWRDVRRKIHDDVCNLGYNQHRNTFVQQYGGQELDAALLMIPLVGFLPATDSRMLGTVQAIEQDLMEGGYVRRYDASNEMDGLPPGEGVFLPCTFWLADNYALSDRRPDAERLFERLLGLRNDVGLLSEEYDPAAARLTGNFPQALSHIALVNTATNLVQADGRAQRRGSS